MVNGDSFGSENAARSVEPITVQNIFNHDSTANVIGTFRTISVDGRITTILTAVVGEDALKDDRRYSGFTLSGKRVDIMEPWRIPRWNRKRFLCWIRTLGRSSSEI
ncbi:hypothetical protein TNCV_2292111 [Trichonephila clavipes]|uniref:Uncharacterized protein n=1 Tax=Trichonephila clavipes TaxID=2585209 RepID=A0A8X6RJX9_TRICX|nr:hypothetical protein TNCV_2292111 [Trichonephila clavipes]